MTKWQYSSAVHDRPLSVLACGGFPLTDYRADLDESFEPGEIAYYRSLDEASDLIDYYTKNETERLDMIKKGRKRVLKHHTYTHRAKALLSILSQAG